MRETIRNFSLLATTLIGTEPELFAEVDRNRAEAELRLAIFFPSLFLAFVLAVTWSPLWLLAVLGAVALLYQGQIREERAIDIVADALQLGRVKAPALERLESATTVAIERKLLESS